MEPNTPPKPPASAGERRLARLVVPAPSAYETHHRIDWIHDPLPPPSANQDADQTATGTDDEAGGARLPDA